MHDVRKKAKSIYLSIHLSLGRGSTRLMHDVRKKVESIYLSIHLSLHLSISRVGRNPFDARCEEESGVHLSIIYLSIYLSLGRGGTRLMHDVRKKVESMYDQAFSQIDKSQSKVKEKTELEKSLFR